MANVYNGQLDAFELYHIYQKHDLDGPNQTTKSAFLHAIGDGISGSTGAAISNIVTYPLNLIITRLQIQRQVKAHVSESNAQEYTGFWDAANKILEAEGWTGFYTGLAGDTSKTFLDGFLFFLTYDALRRYRLRSGGQSGSGALPAIEELGVGFVAGSLTKLCTTPIANVVTRQQAASLTSKETPSLRAIAQKLMHEQGLLGFWSGYSASLILTLNPSITFFLFETLKKITLPRSARDNPPAIATFFLAATSKASAACITYPFSLAKARLQAGGSGKDEGTGDEILSSTSKLQPRAKTLAQDTVLSTLLTIFQNEGASALYEGLHLEILKSFFSHGITMLVKQMVQKIVARLYYMFTLVVSSRRRRLRAGKLAEMAKASGYEYYDLAIKRSSDKLEDIKRITLAEAEAAREKAMEVTGYVSEYIDEDTGDGEDIFGITGLAKWLDNRVK